MIKFEFTLRTSSAQIVVTSGPNNILSQKCQYSDDYNIYKLEKICANAEARWYILLTFLTQTTILTEFSVRFKG